MVRLAEAGERMVITVDGVPRAQLGPLVPTGVPTIEDLIATGLVRPAATRDHPGSCPPVALPIDARPDLAIEEQRGHTKGRTKR